MRRAAAAAFITPPQLLYIQNAKGLTNFNAFSGGNFIGLFFFNFVNFTGVITARFL